MKGAWVMPHPILAWPDGHTTRAAVACAAVDGLEPVDSLRQLEQPWQLAVFDTWAESRCAIGAYQLKARGIPIASIDRALNQPASRPEPAWDLVLQPGPYEGRAGAVIDPLVDVLPASVETDVLVLVSGYRPPRLDPWWGESVEELRASGADFTVLSELPLPGAVSGRGAEWVSKANVVVGGGGAGSLYETLWAGKPLVARAFSLEQHARLSAAIAAGEAVVPAYGSLLEAIAEARTMPSLGLRASGAQQLAHLLEGLA